MMHFDQMVDQTADRSAVVIHDGWEIRTFLIDDQNRPIKCIVNLLLDRIRKTGCLERIQKNDNGIQHVIIDQFIDI